MWNWFKRLFGGSNDALRDDEDKTSGSDEDIDLGMDFSVVTDTPWGIPVLDVQPFTQTMMSMSSNPEMASNAVSYTGLEAAEFGSRPIDSTNQVPLSFAIPLDGPLIDGVIEKPHAMEDKWALYVHDSSVVIVRSWTREVVGKAQFQVDNNVARFISFTGSIMGEEDEPAFTAAAVEYLIRDFGLGEGLLAPIPIRFEEDHQTAATIAFSMYGRQARFVALPPFEQLPPERPLCTFTPLHIAIAQGDLAEAKRLVDDGAPWTSNSPDGSAPIHFALNLDVLKGVLDLGCPVDTTARGGATTLMRAAEKNDVAEARLCLSAGANVNAVDDAGYAVLHRAAHTGSTDVLQLLLDNGARIDVGPDGQTPVVLAEEAGQTKAAAMLRSASE